MCRSKERHPLKKHVVKANLSLPCSSHVYHYNLRILKIHHIMIRMALKICCTLPIILGSEISSTLFNICIFLSNYSINCLCKNSYNCSEYSSRQYYDYLINQVYSLNIESRIFCNHQNRKNYSYK